MKQLLNELQLNDKKGTWTLGVPRSVMKEK